MTKAYFLLLGLFIKEHDNLQNRQLQIQLTTTQVYDPDILFTEKHQQLHPTIQCDCQNMYTGNESKTGLLSHNIILKIT